MKKRSRRLLTLLLALAFLSAGAAVFCGWQGSWRLYAPPRSAVQDYEQGILDRPADHGLAIRAYTGPAGTPCLLVTSSPSPGPAEKGRALRTALEKQRRLPLPPWGDSASGTIVMLHGMGGHKENHLPICERFCAAGFRCLLLDLPAHGTNPAPTATFGKDEAALACAVLEDATRRFQLPPRQPAFLFGFSQGGAIALQAAAHDPSQWAGVISVAGFASLDGPLENAVRDRLPRPVRFATPLIYGGVCLGARSRAGYWPADIRPVDAAARLHLPVFLAHGEKDGIIPVEEARRIFAALPDSRKTFRLIAGANHSNVLSQDRDVLYPDMCEFLLKATAPASDPTPHRGE